jgi:hypothetical protein
MKINSFEDKIKSMSGKSKHGNHVFVTRKDGKTLLIKKANPPITEQNKLASSKFKAMSILWKLLPNHFKEDCKEYAHLYNLQHLPENKLTVNAYNIFTMAVCKHLKPINSIDELISILGNNLNEWINNGYLKKVKKSNEFSGCIS